VQPVTVETGVVHQDTLQGDTERILGIRDGRVIDRAFRRKGVRVRSGAEPLLADDAVHFRGQAIRSDQHPRRADRQRIEGVGEFRGERRIDGDADVPAAHENAKRKTQSAGGKLAFVWCFDGYFSRNVLFEHIIAQCLGVHFIQMVDSLCDL